MSDIKQREIKMQEKRKQTDFRQYLKEVASWMELVFYRNSGLISRFPSTDRKNNIQKSIDFEKSRDDLINHGLLYDNQKDFFTQRGQLFKSIPTSNVIDFGMNENSEFADGIQASKNAYLSFVVINGCENILYSFSVKDLTKNVLNSVMILGGSDNVYHSSGVKSSYNIFYSKYIYDSSDIWFSTNLKNCNECILCDNLEHENYCIKNKKLEKEEYFKQKDELMKNKLSFIEYYKSILSTKGNNIACDNSEGNFLMNCSNVRDGNLSFNVVNAKNIILSFSNEENKEYYDLLCSGRSEHLYGGVVIGSFSNMVFNSMFVSNSSNIYYSYGINDCSFCIGCIGLKNKTFCIFNKQYTKEERYEKANEIFSKMDQNGTLGNFLPGLLNPFYFNDTVAYLIDNSFTKEEVTAEGYLRRDEEIKVDIPVGSEVVYSYQVEGQKSINDFQGFDSEGNWKIDPEILKKVIVDEKGNSYRIIKMEYDFLMKYGLPLPELHWLDRIKLGFRFK